MTYGREKVMANYFHVALRGSARSWLMNLPPGSISSWDDLCHQFVANFQGTFTRLGLECDLHAVKQQEGETLRRFIQRFSQVRNTIPRIAPTLSSVPSGRASATSGCSKS